MSKGAKVSHPKIDGAGWPDWAPRVCSRCGQRVTLRQARVLSYSVILGTGKTLHLDPADCPELEDEAPVVTIRSLV